METWGEIRQSYDWDGLDRRPCAFLERCLSDETARTQLDKHVWTVEPTPIKHDIFGQCLKSPRPFVYVDQVATGGSYWKLGVKSGSHMTGRGSIDVDAIQWSLDLQSWNTYPPTPVAFFTLRGRKMNTIFFWTKFSNTPKGPGHPGKIPGTSQVPPYETQGRRTFAGGHELFDPHPFAWKTPTRLRTQEVNLCALFSGLNVTELPRTRKPPNIQFLLLHLLAWPPLQIVAENTFFFVENFGYF